MEVTNSQTIETLQREIKDLQQKLNEKRKLLSTLKANKVNYLINTQGQENYT